MTSGIGAPGDGKSVKVTVVDRRHHAAAGAPAAGPEERSPYPTFVEELKARTEAAERKARDAMARAEAEIDAVRERLQRDVDKRVARGEARFLAAVLDVMDSLDRAAGAAAESEAVARGVGLIRQQLASVLRNQGVEPIETLGQPYDPNVAEAVVLEPVDADRDNIVLEEIQRGYRFRDMILRPARVKVGKAASAAAPRASSES
jgi:molecular chaperone GrpE